VGLADVADARAGELSFGQRKRVALAQCLGAQPRFLALDEPLAGLDLPAAGRVTELLRVLSQRGIGVLTVEHSLSFTFEACDRVIVMADGRIVVDGPPANVRTDPRALEVQLR
jgi:ABC-type branched-subunit amino acid transport system ATPase component